MYECESVIDYLKKIEELNNHLANKYIVYRGEIQDYGKTKCCPNIFRNKGYEKNEYYEKNILDEMSANNIGIGDYYLLKAMNAQHGGFPSRLLDISFNPLVALHFAINPHYKESTQDNISYYDNKDGFVYVLNFNKIYSPYSGSVKDCYETIITKKMIFPEQYVFSQNYKLIDHIKLNQRIIAQTGGFILFPGKEFHKLPDWMYETIKIPNKSKKTIRDELNSIFSINNGTMYPEASNQVEYITQKSLFVSNDEFDFVKELYSFLCFLKNECDNFCTTYLYNKKLKTKEIIKEIRKFEKEILLYDNEYHKTKDLIEKKMIKDSSNNEMNVLDQQYIKIITDLKSEINKYFSNIKKESIELLF